MRLCVLGPLEIAGGDRRLRLGSECQRAILAVLTALRSQVVSRDRLIEAVWGARAPVTARKSLHSHVSRLRRALAAVAPDGAGVVATATDGYRLDLGDHELDAHLFQALLVLAREEVDEDPRRAVGRFDEALALWRGEAFGELAAHELVRPEAVRLNELRASAIAGRVDALLALGNHPEAIGELEGVVAGDPLAERAHGQLMLALYQSGRQADALAAYQSLRRRLGNALGIDPSHEVQRLHERILRQDPELAAPASAASSGGGRVTAPEPSGQDLSCPASGGLIGRDGDVAAVAPLVTSASLVTLTGPGGVGKSRLAEAVAATVRERFEDGVVVCGLAAVADPAGVTEVLVDAVGAQHKGDRSPEETLLAALGARQLLLLLDNCEHVLEAVASITARIRGVCPRVTVLATSREVLHLPGERVWEVSPLAVPRAGASAAEVAETSAGALLCARAQAVEPSFALTETNAATVAELCRRLDGIPLAIELAAARIRALAPDDLALRIDQRFDLLTGGSHRGERRQRTLQAVVDWSYELLTDPQARLFDRLSVFAGPFPLVAAERVCAGQPLGQHEIAGVLAELVDKSMVAVDRTDAGVRYRLLDTLRVYGAKRLEQTDAAERGRSAHAAYHLRLVEELAPQVRGRDEGAALARIDAAIDDLRIAHAWCVDAGDVDGALRLPAALHDYLTFGPRAAVFAWTERAVEMKGAREHPARPAALATVARGAVNRGDLRRARRDAEAALAHAGAEDRTALWALYVLTNVALYEGRFDDVLTLADRRIGLAETLGEDYHRALADVSRVLGHRYRGDGDAAVRAAATARTAAEAAGNHTARAWALYASGEALLDTQPEEAAGLLEQAVDAARRVGRHFIEGVALVSLASLSGRRGETDRALALFRETVAHWRRLGDYTHQLTTLRNLVDLFASVGAEEAAAVLHGAVTVGSPPSLGAEAQRLAAAWARAEQRLGADGARTAAERGRHQPLADIVEGALATLDALLEVTTRTRADAP